MEDAQSAVQPEQESVSSVDGDSSDAGQKRRRNIFIGVCVMAAVVCFCIGISVVDFGWGTVVGPANLTEIEENWKDVTAVIDQYMREMENENAAAAHALYSSRAQRLVPLSKVEGLLEGNDYVLFEAYEGVMVKALAIKSARHTNPDEPQGTIAEASGAVTYKGGVTGVFTALLEEEGGTWRLHYIDVIVPPGEMDSP